jgi:hypothetical protein
MDILNDLINALAEIETDARVPARPATRADLEAKAVTAAHHSEFYGDESYCTACSEMAPCTAVRVATGMPLIPCTPCQEAAFEYGKDLWAPPVIDPACAQALQPRPLPEAPPLTQKEKSQAVRWIERLASTAAADAETIEQDSDTPEGRELARLRLRIARMEQHRDEDRAGTGTRTRRHNVRLQAIREYAKSEVAPEVRQALLDLLDAEPSTPDRLRHPGTPALAAALDKR